MPLLDILFIYLSFWRSFQVESGSTCFISDISIIYSKFLSLFIFIRLPPYVRLVYDGGSCAFAFFPPTFCRIGVSFRKLLWHRVHESSNGVLQCGHHQDGVIFQEVNRLATVWILPLYVIGCMTACELSMKLYICTIHCTLENHFVLSHPSEFPLIIQWLVTNFKWQ